MRRLVGLLFLSCAATPPAPVCPRAVAKADPPPPPPIVVTKPASRCPHFAAAKVEEDPKKKDPSCRSLEEGKLEAVERTLRKRFQTGFTPHKLVIDYACDTVDEAVREIDYEDGNGHGGSLRIFHLTRVPGDPAKYDVRAIAYSGYYNAGIAFARTSIDGRKLEASLEAARIAMVAQMHDVALYRENGGIGLGGFSSSSHDFHIRIRVSDAAGHFLDRGFTGYTSTHLQETRIPMELADEPFAIALKPVQFTADPPVQADRELFVRHFLTTFEKEPFWWVGERMLEMAATLGTVEIVPAIVAWLAKPADKNGGTERIRGTAVAALAAITGLDLRKTPAENGPSVDRPLEEVIADYIRECG